MIARLRRIPQRLYLIVIVFAGWGLAELADLNDIANSAIYTHATSLLLAIGLFGSTYAIDRTEAREHKQIIVTAVTVGVFVKAALIAGVLVLITQDPVFVILGVAVAQIDPLSVATLLGDDRMSPRVKTILAAWASFDDPITVLLVVYASAIATGSFASPGSAVVADSADGVSGLAAALLPYTVDLIANLALAALAALVWYGLRRWSWLRYPLLAALAVLAIWQFLMLAVAIAGLFVRPAALDRVMNAATRWALLVAAAMLGLLLVNGVALVNGLLLGLAAFGSQMVVGWLLSRRLSRTDRIHLALAQQNGITAIILALRLETQFAGAVAVIAPAIFFTNLTYYLANGLADRLEHRRARRLDSVDGSALPADDAADDGQRERDPA